MTWPGVAAISGEILHSTNDEAFVGFARLNGDIVGLLESATVSGLAGFPLAQVTPTNGQVLKFDGTNWAPGTDDTGGGAAHDLLSSTHTDANDYTVARGSLIVGTGSVPAWGGLALGGTGQVLYSDGTDVGYTQLGSVTPFSLGTAAAPSMTFSGDVDTGVSAETADNLALSAGGNAHLTVDGVNDTLLMDAGQQVKLVTDIVNYTVTRADFSIGVVNAPATVTLPAAPGSGQMVVVKDKDGNATSSNRITIAGNGNNIDGNASIQIRNAYGSFTLMFNGGTWNVI
jgi:hypothetical protein